jgi:hypothetical protein
MALAATDSNIEARIARLESDVGHIRSDLAFDKLLGHMSAAECRLLTRLSAFERSLASAKRWALLLYVAQAVGVYATLARTMGWI